jgi:hypothetical protein
MHMATRHFRGRWTHPLLALGLLLAACGGDKLTPEAQVRQFVQAGTAAAEARDVSAIRDLIAEDYLDDAQRRRQDLVRLTLGYFLRHKNIHLFTRISDIRFPTPDRAALRLYVAMAGQPVTDAEALLDLRADLYRFDLVLQRRDGAWLLTKAQWRQAQLADFVSP